MRPKELSGKVSRTILARAIACTAEQGSRSRLAAADYQWHILRISKIPRKSVIGAVGRLMHAMARQKHVRDLAAGEGRCFTNT